MFISTRWYVLSLHLISPVAKMLKLVGRPLVDDTILINYLTNRYQVSAISVAHDFARPVFE